MTESIKLLAVVRGEDMVIAVPGGFVRRRANDDGIVVINESESVFLPEHKLAEALAALDRRRTSSQAALRPMRAAQMQLPAFAPKKANRAS